MVTSLSTKGPQQSEEKETTPQGVVGLTVTGVNAKGHMFRERTAVLSLDGRDCKYQSNHEVQSDSWVLLDIDYGKAAEKSCRVQGKVKSVQPVGATHELFQIGVELEVAQSVRVVSNQEQAQPTVQQTAAPQPPIAATQPRGLAEAPAPPTQARLHTPPRPSSDEGAAGMAKNHELLAMVREAAKSAVVSEINQRLGALRNSLSAEVEKAVQANVPSRTEKMTRDETWAEMGRRIKDMRADVEAALARALVSEKQVVEATLRAQEALERLKEADRISTEKSDSRLAAQMHACSAEFNERLNEIVIERAARFASEVEQQLIPHLKRADDTLEKLAAGLQLAQGSLQAQKKQLAELSRTAAANFEKDIKAFLLRLSAAPNT